MIPVINSLWEHARLTVANEAVSGLGIEADVVCPDWAWTARDVEALHVLELEMHAAA